MASTMGLSNLFTSNGFRAYLAEFLRDAGATEDPIEVMLLQQIALAHFRVGGLHAQAAETARCEAAKVYNAAAVRLLGELRKTVVALQDYRQARGTRRVKGSAGKAGEPTADAGLPKSEARTELGSRGAAG